MKYYGFNPFVYSEQSDRLGMIYDLLNEKIFKVPPVICDAFGGETYRPLEEIELALKEYEEINVTELLAEGMGSGLIVEVSKPKRRIGVNHDFFKSGRRITLLRKISIQPTGKCRKNCTLCDEYLSGTCVKNESSWSSTQIDRFFAILGSLKHDFFELNLIGGDLLSYKYLDHLLAHIVKADLVNNRISFSFLFESGLTESKNFKDFFHRMSREKFPLIVNFKLIPHSQTLFDQQEEEIIKFIDQTGKLSNVIVTVDLLMNRVDPFLEGVVERLRQSVNYLNLNYLYKKDLSNLQELRGSVDFFSENVDFDEFYFRKKSHRCWGYSIAITSSGEIKPCLWSRETFGEWDEGDFKHKILNPKINNRFWASHAIDEAGSDYCKACPLRYCCKHCKVLEEFGGDYSKGMCAF